MKNATLLIQSRKPEEQKRFLRKGSITPAVIIKQRFNVRNEMTPPDGGFTTLTLRQQKIVSEIQSHPRLTSREYADRLLILAKDVHDTLLFSREGRALAEQGLICISEKGALPRWAKLCANKHLIFTRRRQPQIKAEDLPSRIKGEKRTSLEQAIATMQDIIISTSNRRMKNLLDKAVIALIGGDRTDKSENKRLIQA